MRSRTSFFNKTVFWSDQRRYWPLTAGYALVWLLILPLTRFVELNHDPFLSAYNAQRDTLNAAAVSGCWVSLYFGVFFAMAAFSYLTNPRATNGLHALPARRETLYVTHVLAGLCAQLAVQIFALLLTAAVLAGRGALDARTLWLCLLALALPTFFFYLFGVFCMMFTGQILAAPVFYAILNILVVGVEFLLRVFAGNFLYGWADDATPFFIELSPIVKLASAVGVGEGYSYTVADGGVAQDFSGVALHGLGWLLIYAVAGLIFAALGLLVYRARRSEATGEVVAVAWAKPIFKYGVTVCVALAFGQLFYEIFFGRYQMNGDYSLPAALACMAAAGLLGYFVAEMLLKKSFRVFKDGWRGAAVVTAAMVLLGVAMSLDLTGYEGYVPAAGEVAQVRVDWNSYYGWNTGCHVILDSEEGIRLAEEAHRAIVRDKSRQLDLSRQGVGTETDKNGIASSVQGYFSVCYTLKNGREVSRRYSDVCFFASELGDPASPAAAMTALYNAEEVTLQRALGYEKGIPPYSMKARALTDLRFTGGYVDVTRYDGTGYLGQDTVDLTPAQAQAVYDAILRDVAAGRVNDSIFAASEDSDACHVELYATYLAPRGEADGSTAPDDDSDRANLYLYPALSDTMTETRAALREAGVRLK